MKRYTLTFALQANRDAPAVDGTVTVDGHDLKEAEYAGFAILMERHTGRFTIGRLTQFTERLIICGSVLLEVA